MGVRPFLHGIPVDAHFYVSIPFSVIALLQFPDSPPKGHFPVIRDPRLHGTCSKRVQKISVPKGTEIVSVVPPCFSCVKPQPSSTGNGVIRHSLLSENRVPLCRSEGNFSCRFPQTRFQPMAHPLCPESTGYFPSSMRCNLSVSAKMLLLQKHVFSLSQCPRKFKTSTPEIPLL